MFIQKEKVTTNVKNSWCFTIDENVYAYLNENWNITIVQSDVHEVVINYHINRVHLSKDLLFILKEDNSLITYDYLKRTYVEYGLDESDKIIWGQDLSKEDIFFSQQISLIEVTTGRLNRKTGIKTIIENFYPCFFVKNLIFGKVNNKIIKYSIDGGDLWQFDLQQLGTFFKIGRGNTKIEVFKFLGVFENDLLVLLNDSSILRLDIKTGGLVNRFCLTLFKNTSKELKAIYSNIQLYGDILVYFRSGKYAEYCLKDDIIKKEFDIENQLKNKKLHDNAPGYIKENNLLYYFVTGFGSFSLPSLVVFDLVAKEIIWKDVHNNPNVSYKDFRKNKNNLFVLDSDNTLHIFEKESV
ncbi:hypothetical protein ATO12_03660 [Aquimarina atlantica]|uniref:Uncharacterized protein n=1 Tax=Aquimarina atlantica TaxID=1317122 RepID=A0A023C0V3_9FLAO|nr:hypothetical protein [Aquimarina atlantica]EZH75900.1 hypothetical protein ATO12_03660 [Aquimarina atlantica]